MLVFDIKTEKYEKNGEKYIKYKKFNEYIKQANIILYFENLIDGHPELGIFIMHPFVLPVHSGLYQTVQTLNALKLRAYQTVKSETHYWWTGITILLTSYYYYVKIIIIRTYNIFA